VRIGVISAYPDEDWDARRIAEAASRRGDARVLAPTDFAVDVPRVTVDGDDVRAYDVLLTPRALGDFGDAEAQLEIYRAIAETGVPLVNDVGALLAALDKLRGSWALARACVPTPRAVLAQHLRDAARALDEMGVAVVKPLYGSLGRGVERVARGDDARLAARLAERGAIYLQEFVDATLDVRAFVVGREVVGAIARRPPPGEFRSNLELGADARAVMLDGRTAAVAVAAARALGLDYAGVDLRIADGARGALVIEVNGTPSFRGVERATGRDVAAAIVDHALARAAPRSDRRGARRNDGEGSRPPRWHAGRSARRADDARPLRTHVLRADRPQGRAKGA
jgi:tetrahydromethanopterin:alpha-L-glutamate ligase